MPQWTVLTDCSMVFLLLLFREIEVKFVIWCEEGNPERWMWSSYCCSDIHVSRIGCCNKEFQSWLSSGGGRIWASLQREIGEYQSGQLESIQFLGICYLIFIFWGWIRWDGNSIVFIKKQSSYHHNPGHILCIWGCICKFYFCNLLFKIVFSITLQTIMPFLTA